MYAAHGIACVWLYITLRPHLQVDIGAGLQLWADVFVGVGDDLLPLPDAVSVGQPARRKHEGAYTARQLLRQLQRLACNAIM